MAVRVRAELKGIAGRGRHKDRQGRATFQLVHAGRRRKGNVQRVSWSRWREHRYAVERRSLVHLREVGREQDGNVGARGGPEAVGGSEELFLRDMEIRPGLRGIITPLTYVEQVEQRSGR